MLNVFFASVFISDHKLRGSQCPELNDHGCENNKLSVNPELVQDLLLQLRPWCVGENQWVWGSEAESSPQQSVSPPSLVPLLETVDAGTVDIYPLYLNKGDHCKIHQQRDQSHLTFHAYSVDTTPKFFTIWPLTLAFTLMSQALGRNNHCKSLK